MEKLQFWCSHLSLAHLIWKGLVQPGDWVVDATCGNGKDCFYLAHLVGPSGGVIALDIQPKAIRKSQEVCQEPWVHFFCQSHEVFPSLVEERCVKLVVYNLGYLPGGDHAFTTMAETTIKSVKRALHFLQVNGIISITCYPGHCEGERELSVLRLWIHSLSPEEVSVAHTKWSRTGSPELFIIQKKSTKRG